MFLITHSLTTLTNTKKEVNGIFATTEELWDAIKKVFEEYQKQKFFAGFTADSFEVTQNENTTVMTVFLTNGTDFLAFEIFKVLPGTNVHIPIFQHSHR